MHPDPALGGDGAREVGEVLVLHHGQDVGGDVVDRRVGQEPAAPVLEEGRLVGHG